MIAALWSMVSALAGVVIVVVVGLIAAVVVGIAWLVSSGAGVLADPEIIWRAARVATWVMAGLVMAVAVWVAAYSSTEWGSRPRAFLAMAGAAVAAVGYFLLGSTGLIVAGLGVGWAIAIPAERVGRVAARAVVCLSVGLAFPGFGAVSGGMLAVLLVVSPWGAASICWAVDVLWRLATRRLFAPLEP